MVIDVNASKHYAITVQRGILGRVGEALKSIIEPSRVLVVTDSNVDVLYSDALIASLTGAGFAVDKYVFTAGESSKTISTVTDILGTLARLGYRRSDILVALGGGVTGDMTGFAASIYMRGVRFVQVPTTLLAAIDSSVGGKTGVDMPEGKNLVGSFYQPEAVYVDPDIVDVLPEQIFSQGMAEAIKYGMIRDRALFELIENGGDIEEIIYRCVSIKRDVVETDEFDRGERMLLNFGHTYGHAIEKLSEYKLSHGEAVAIGMVMATRRAERMGYAYEPMSDRLIACLTRYGLPTETDVDGESLSGAVVSDKKRNSTGTCFILPRSIGRCESYLVRDGELDGFLEV